MKIEQFNSHDRAKEKALSRQKDEELLASGKMNTKQISKKNFFFGALDFSKMKIIRKNKKMKDN